MARSPLPLGHPSTGRRHGGPFDTVLDSGGWEKGKLTRPAPPQVDGSRRLRRVRVTPKSQSTVTAAGREGTAPGRADEWPPVP